MRGLLLEVELWFLSQLLLFDFRLMASRRLLQTETYVGYHPTHVWGWEILHIFVLGMIFIPISIYGLFRYYKLRKIMVIKKRSARIVLLTGVIVIFELFRRIWVFTYLTISMYPSVELCYSCIFRIEIIIYPMLVHGLTYSILWRFFVMFYKANWTKSIINLKKLEEETVGDQRQSLSVKKDFFIKYKASIGNVYYNGKGIVTIYLISFITSAITLQSRFISSIIIYI